MSNNIIYTYVVDHGISAPRVGLNTEVNGGKLLVVAFADLSEKVEEMESLLNKLESETTCDQTRYSIEDYLN